MNTKILVVDDDPTILNVVKGYLEQAGYNVLSAKSGDTAMHMLRVEKPDLLVLDLMLPDKDGWEITRWIRADRALVALPVIMLTARVEDSDKIIGLSWERMITSPNHLTVVKLWPGFGHCYAAVNSTNPADRDRS